MIAEFDPGRSVVAWPFPASYGDIDAAGPEPRRGRRIKQQVVHAQTRRGVVAAAIGEVPVCVDALLRVKSAQRIYPPLAQEAGVGLSAFGEIDGVAVPASRDNGIDGGWNDIVVAA